MSDVEAPQVVISYLAQLDAELASVDEAVARDIRAGVVEELQGLDAAAAAVRIEQLGDPAFIAAEARDAGGHADARSVDAATRHPRAATWYVVTAALLVAVGGAVVPVLGWLIGIVMVCLSPAWRLWEKLLVPGAPLVCIAASLTITSFSSPSQSTGNPLIPQAYDMAWTAVVLFAFANFAIGIWLLVRALGRVRA